jgi:drug/metabolite transporter (DMT)-like permease
MQRFIRSSWIWVIYLVIGVIVAIGDDYFDFHFPWRLILSAILAVLLWPLTLVGIDLHID